MGQDHDHDLVWGVQHTPHGDLRVAVPTGADDGLAQAVARGDAGMPPAAALILAQTPADALVVDVGAHLGLVSLPIAASGRRVISVEGSPMTARALRASSEANGLGDRLTVVNAILSNVHAVLDFHEDGPYSHVAAPGETVTAQVASTTFVDLLDSSASGPAMVKIDTEGHEPECLEALFAAFPASPPPDLVVESNGHTLSNRGVSVSALISQLGARYQHLYELDEGRLRARRAGTTQSRTVVDFFATNAATTAWPVSRAPSTRRFAKELAEEMRHPNPMQRAWAIREVGSQSPAVRRARVLRTATTRAMNDEDPTVRTEAQQLLD